MSEKRLRLWTVLADDTEVVATRLAVPALWILHVIRSELAETVRAKQNFVRGIVCNDHLGPVDHRGGNEVELVRSEVEDIPFLDHQTIRRYGRTEELLHELERLRGRDNRRRRILRKEAVDVSGMVRLHVLHY